MFVYRCVMERQTCPEIGWYQSFGLAVYCTRPGSQVLLTALFDITLDRAFVERLQKTVRDFSSTRSISWTLRKTLLHRKNRKKHQPPAFLRGKLVLLFFISGSGLFGAAACKDHPDRL